MSKLVGQIIRYGLIGALATAINLAVAVVLDAYVWPCLNASDFAVRYLGLPSAAIDAATRARYAVYGNLAGFFIANVVCWLLNRKFVFVPGRHGWMVEYLLFLAGSGLAIVVGNAVIYLVIALAGVETTCALAINVAVSVAVNFIVRKFIVFKE